MAVEIIGPQLFERDDKGNLKSRVATVFPARRLVVTVPGIHAWQRNALIDHLNEQRKAAGQPPLTSQETEKECACSVDLILDDNIILIRPDPDQMELAFEADVLLQEVVSKRQIKFLNVLNSLVQHAIKSRGEYWRISALPLSRDGMRKMIDEAMVSIREGAIYYYNRLTGTRFLTFDKFTQLASLDAVALARQLDEIGQHCNAFNRFGHPEVGFFAVEGYRFGPKDFKGIDFSKLHEEELSAKYLEIRNRFRDSVPPEYREDDSRVETWRNAMFSRLVSQRDDTVTETILRGLSPEFFMQIEWLPGGHFEEGEFLFDSIFDEAYQNPEDIELARLCDQKAKGFIFNFIREYGNIEYVNVGRIVSSLSDRPDTQKKGRRDVYIAEFKLRRQPDSIVRFMRLVKWGLRERLNDGKSMLAAILETDEYVDYTLDRRLGCFQLGMNLPPGITIRRVTETYNGSCAEYVGQPLRETYIERDYLAGIATDKLQTWKYAREGFAVTLARLLGKAAASNIIVGRTHEEGSRVVFDDGDEVVMEDPATGLPGELVVGDHSGAFGEYERPLASYAKDYARPVNKRVTMLPNPRVFGEAYLAAFLEAFIHIQGDYRKRRRAFDNLFKHRAYDRNGSFAFRWESVLKRLDQTDAFALVEAIRKHITVMPSADTSVSAPKMIF
jgi:hypothetical protein